MRHATSALLALGLLLVAARPTAARAETLSNDGFVAGGGAAFSAGFVATEIAASRFTPSGPGQLTTLQFLFGGSTLMTTVTVHVWEDAAGANAPGTELYSGDVMLTGADMALGEIDLSGAAIHVTGPFRVGFEYSMAGPPTIARDEDGTISAGNNFIKAVGTGWNQSATLGVSGDWILRAVVELDPDAGVSVDAGTDASASDAGTDASLSDAGTDASMPDASMPDASATTCRVAAECGPGRYCSPMGTCASDCRTSADCTGGATCSDLGQCLAPAGGGCGCRVTPSGRGGAALSLCVAALLVARRRRARRA